MATFMCPHLSWTFSALVLAVLTTVGCQNFAPPHQAWTEALVEGRILNSQTREPISGVGVSRVYIQKWGDAYPDQKGGKQMQYRPTVAVSGSDGRFTLDAEKTAYLFLESFPSYKVTLRFQQSGYLTRQQTFTNVIPSTNGLPPRIMAGDVFMNPRR